MPNQYSQQSHNRRQEAINDGLKVYLSDTPCKKCGCVFKYVSSYGCHFCQKQKGYAKLMSGALDKYHTPEVTRNRIRRWRKNNPDKYQEQWKRDRERGGGIRTAKRRAIQRDQTPNLTLEETQKIKEIYKECVRMSKETGIPHHVDHIIPLAKGGIHHPDNLQILTAKENLSKGAKLQWD